MKAHRLLCLLVCLYVIAIVQTQAQLKLLSPNGGEVFTEDSVIAITWSGVSRFDEVSIDVRQNTTSAWQNITPSATGLRYNWRVPLGQPSTEYSIRINTKNALRADSTKVIIMAGGHGAAVYNAIASTDGSRVYSIGEGGLVKEWNSWTGELLREFSGAYDPYTIRISPNDRYLAFGGNRVVHVVDLLSGDVSEIATSDFVGELFFDQASANVIAWNSTSNHVVVIDVADKRIKHDFSHPNYVGSTQLSPDGTHVLTTCSDHIVRIWSLEGDSLSRQYVWPGFIGMSAQFNFDGSQIITLGFEHTVRMWDTETGDAIDSLVHPDVVRNVQYSPDGSQIVTCTDSVVYVWSSTTHQVLYEIRPNYPNVKRALFSTNGNYILTDYGFKRVDVWNSSNGSHLFTPEGEWLKITSAFVSTDDRLFTASLDAGLRAYNISTQTLLYTTRGHECITDGSQNRVLHASFTPDGAAVLSASEDGTIKSWNAQTGTFNFSTPHKPAPFEYIVVHQPTGKIAATNTFGVFLYGANGTPIGEYATDATEQHLHRAVLSPDGEYISVIPDSTLEDTSMTVISGRNGEKKYDIVRYNERFMDAAFSPNNLWMATVSDNGQVRIFDTETGEQAYHFATGDGTLRQIVFSPNGKWLAYHGYSKYIWLIDAQAWMIVDSLEATTDIQKFAWSPDSKLIASVSIDRVDIIDVALRAQLTHDFVVSHRSNKTDVAFSPNGKNLAVMSSNVDVFETTSWNSIHHLDGRNTMLHIQWASDNNRILVVSLHHQPWVWDFTPITDMADQSDGMFSVIEEQTGVDEITDVAFSIYPIPTSDVLHIRMQQTVAGQPILIVSILGDILYRGIMNAEQTTIDTKEFPSGAYALYVGSKARVFCKN